MVESGLLRRDHSDKIVRDPMAAYRLPHAQLAAKGIDKNEK
jgi:hypothetical protein